MFTLLTYLLQNALTSTMLTFVSTAVARFISSMFNFYMNKKMVFDSSVSTGKAMLRYYMLAVPQAILQMLLTDGAYVLVHIGTEQTFLRFIIYCVVMCLLFVFSFLIQQRWVFAGKKEK